MCLIRFTTLVETCLLSLVAPSSLLASLQLFEVVRADIHVALVLIHALCEALNVSCTWSLCLLCLGRLAVVKAVVHRLGVGVCWLLVLLLLLSRCRRRTTAEEAPDRMADGGADSYTTVDGRGCQYGSSIESGNLCGESSDRHEVTYAAVLAICPNSPGLCP